MNKMLKIGVAALAISAVCPAFADQVEEEVESSVIGFTPVAIGLATPVQLPWGINRWDVFGLDFNLFYSDAPKMYGVDFGGFAPMKAGRKEWWMFIILLGYALIISSLIAYSFNLSVNCS